MPSLFSSLSPKQNPPSTHAALPQGERMKGKHITAVTTSFNALGEEIQKNKSSEKYLETRSGREQH